MNPLIVDFDGTLIPFESISLLRFRFHLKHPFQVSQLRDWRNEGKQVEKLELWRNVPFRVDKLLMRKSILELIAEYKSQGSKVYLVSGSSEEQLHDISEFLGIFDGVSGSTLHTNLTGFNKRNYLIEQFGHFGFDYVGNSIADIPIWKVAKNGFNVNSTRKLRHEITCQQVTVRSIQTQRTISEMKRFFVLLFSVGPKTNTHLNPASK